MTKSEFTTQLASSCNISLQEGEKVLNSFLDSLEDGLYKDGRVMLPGFGVFEVRHVEAKKGRNLHSGEEITIPARNVVRFKISKNLKEALNKD